jgi:phage shock protein B
MVHISVFPLLLLIPLLGVVLLIGLPLLVVIMLVSGRRRKTEVSDGQARQLEQTWTRLGRMEERLTNLETILLEQTSRERR